jgi:hypothetical protein
MALRIDRSAEGYAVTVSAPSGEPWVSPHPLTPTAVLQTLSELGCHSTDISDALDAADLEWFRQHGRTAVTWMTLHDEEVRRRRRTSSGDIPAR